MAPPIWDPTGPVIGAAYTYVPLTRFRLKVNVAGRTVRGKLWNASAVEPPAYELTTTSASATGKMVGFYTYLLNGAVLESFAVTVP